MATKWLQAVASQHLNLFENCEMLHSISFYISACVLYSSSVPIYPSCCSQHRRDNPAGILIICSSYLSSNPSLHSWTAWSNLGSRSAQVKHQRVWSKLRAAKSSAKSGGSFEESKLTSVKLSNRCAHIKLFFHRSVWLSHKYILVFL